MNYKTDLMKAIDSNIKQDDLFKNNLKDLLNNTSNYKLKSELNDFGIPSINLYDKNNALVYSVKDAQNLTESLSAYIKTPELLISEVVNNAIQQYITKQTKPNYFQ